MRHRIFIPAAIALLLGLAACTQDELADDNRLPEGEYPVVIRATGLSVEATPLAASSTRAAVDGDWQGVTSVALKMGDAVKEYTVTASTDFKCFVAVYRIIGRQKIIYSHTYSHNRNGYSKKYIKLKRYNNYSKCNKNCN